MSILLFSLFCGDKLEYTETGLKNSLLILKNIQLEIFYVRPLLFFFLINTFVGIFYKLILENT